MMNNLPFDLELYLLKDWISIVEIGKLDSATCNRKDRCDFLKIISCDSFTLRTNKGHDQMNVLKWISLRTIKIFSLFVGHDVTSLPPEMNTSKVVPLQISFSPKISTMHIQSRNIIVSIVKQCPNLKYLLIKGPSTSSQAVFDQLPSNILKQIDLLEMWGQYSFMIPQAEMEKNQEFDIFQSMINLNDGILREVRVHQTIFVKKTIDYPPKTSVMRFLKAHVDSVTDFHMLSYIEPISFSILIDIIAVCKNLKLIRLYNTHLDKLLTIKLTEGSRTFILVHRPKRYTITSQHLVDFFIKFDSFKQVQITDFPLTDEVVKCIIRGSPNCKFKEFINCGVNFDQKLVGEWNLNDV